ncbi:DNA excision repair protein ERCC-6-like [Larimichthys crocea]|uniref:DNA excision repair protein ERCC-6-like n=1 Tax=Larimichthys crocea TaxID=215358 RepID=A0A6G0IMG9_LARCR|nr:DNA excision repair protein ERCC-6-like [Larimichthys crocea]
MQLQTMHSRHRRTDPELDEHIAHLHAMEMFGISDHDLMFSLDVNHDEDPEDQRRTTTLKGGSPYPQHVTDFNGSQIVVESDQSGSDKEDGQQSDRVIDLTADDNTPEEQPVGEVSQDRLTEKDLYSPKHHSVKQERSYSSPQEVIEDSLLMSEDTDAVADASVQELMDVSAVSTASHAFVTAVDDSEQLLPGASPSKYKPEMDATPLQNKRLSMLQASNSSFKADTSSKVSAGLESFEGNFNLQLEDSDMFSDHEILDHQETDAEERNLLSQLQMNGSFDVNKSLSERRHEEALGRSLHTSIKDESMNDSIVMVRKKRAAVIYDSEDEEDGDRQELSKSQLDNSFQVLGASTPKSAPSGSTPLRSRKSIGGNTSVASRRSLLQSIIEDMDNQNQDTEDEDEDEEDVSERHSDEAEEEESSLGQLRVNFNLRRPSGRH